MYQPKGFSDSENIIIMNNIPYFHYNGLTYKDKLKNGLSLEEVFQQEDMFPTIKDENIEEVKNYKSNINLNLIDYEKNYGFYERKEFEINGFNRKGKCLPLKKREARNKKKSSIRVNGYTDKLFAIEQNLPEICDKLQIQENYDNRSIIKYKYDLDYGHYDDVDYGDYGDVDYGDYEDYYYYYRD